MHLKIYVKPVSFLKIRLYKNNQIHNRNYESFVNHKPLPSGKTIDFIFHSKYDITEGCYTLA